MSMLRNEFSSRPRTASKLMPNGSSLNNLITSGWFAPAKDEAKDPVFISGVPSNFKLYHVFVIAPDPDSFVTQIVYGATYSVDDTFDDTGYEDLDTVVHGEVYKDPNTNATVYTSRRIATDLHNDGTLDVDGALDDAAYIVEDNETHQKFDRMQVVINDKDYDVSANSVDTNHLIYDNERWSADVKNGMIESPENVLIINNDNQVSNSSDIHVEVEGAEDNSHAVHTSEIEDESIVSYDLDGYYAIVDNIAHPLTLVVHANEDTDTSSDPETNTEEGNSSLKIKIINRHACFTRSRINDTWTQWKNMQGTSSEGTVIPDEVYSYVDSRVSFESPYTISAPTGMVLEITGSYDKVDYYKDVYDIEAQGVEEENFDDLPAQGDATKLYIVKSENALYRWDEEQENYYCVGRDYLDIDGISSGDSDSQS